MHRSIKPFAFILAIILPNWASAQTAANNTSSEAFGTLLVLGSFLIVLILANAIVANVLLQLARAHRDQEQKTLNKNKGIVTTVLLLAMLALPSAGWAQEVSEAVAAPAAPAVINGIPAVQFYFLISLIGFFMITLLFLLVQVRAFSKMLRALPEKSTKVISWRKISHLLNASVAVKDEARIELDHEYDGIRELDNDLPPWWKWGFVLTIVVSVIYIGYYHFGDGPLQVDEYNMAVKEAEAQQAAHLAKSGAQVDENTVALITDAAVLSDAKALYNNTCAACHKPDGGGSVGPNLTDEYWLHGGSLQDVFKSIKYGWRDKGMPPWGGNLSPKQIAGISSYIKSIQGTKPAGGKAPQGTLYEEKSENAAPAATASKQDSDSSSAAKL